METIGILPSALKAVPKERHLGARVYTLCVTWALRVGRGLQVSDGS